jgi:hypothetical protein
MGETVNIAQMAVLASTEIFSVFGWEQQSLSDQNFDCVETEKHRKIKAKWKKHPTDTVLKYVDPYQGVDIYLNTDLKSYAKGTLDTANLIGTLRSLSRTTECANKSPEWKNLFVDQTRNHEVIGLLFIYNHDGEYDKDFNKQLASLAPSQIQLSPGYMVGVIGPKRVIYLNSIAKDIKSLHSDGNLPGKEGRYFYFPHLNRAAAVRQESPSASLHALLGPLLVIGYNFPDRPLAQRRGFYVYYDGAGESVAEFKYLLDYFFKYQIAAEHTSITVSMVFAHEAAHPTFDAAKREFSRDYWPVANTSQNEFEMVINNIKFRHVQNVVQRFSQRDIGMKERNLD